MNEKISMLERYGENLTAKTYILRLQEKMKLRNVCLFL